MRPEVQIDLAQDRAGEDDVSTLTLARAWARGEAGDDGRWFLEVRALHQLMSGDDLEGWWEPQVGESGWEGPLPGPLRLEVGNLVERWGKLDLLPVADPLNPRDQRGGPHLPPEFQRIPIPMATLTVGEGSVRSETTWIPFASADRMWLRGTDWSFVRQRMIEEQVDEMAGWPGGSKVLLGDVLTTAGETLADLDPSFRRGLDGALAAKDVPQALLLNGELAQRLEVDGPGFDAAFMGAYLRNRQPAAALDPFVAGLLQDERLPEIDEVDALQEAMAGGAVEVGWPRTWFAGAEAGTVVGPFGVRGELAWYSDRVVRQHWGGATTTPSVGAGLGLDYLRGSSLQLMAEARWEHRLGAPEDMLFTPEHSLQLAGGARVSVAQNAVTFQLGGLVDLAYRESMLRPQLTWRASDALQLELGAVILSGRTPPPETLRDALTYEGGPASYWQQNDVVTIGLAWIR